jgi:hypothetical protein
MVYGRSSELVHGGYFMAYKPTDITGGAHPARFAVKAEVYGDGKN